MAFFPKFIPQIGHGLHHNALFRRGYSRFVDVTLSEVGQSIPKDATSRIISLLHSASVRNFELGFGMAGISKDHSHSGAFFWSPADKHLTMANLRKRGVSHISLNPTESEESQTKEMIAFLSERGIPSQVTLYDDADKLDLLARRFWEAGVDEIVIYQTPFSGCHVRNITTMVCDQGIPSEHLSWRFSGFAEDLPSNVHEALRLGVQSFHTRLCGAGPSPWGGHTIPMEDVLVVLEEEGVETGVNHHLVKEANEVASKHIHLPV